MCKLKDCLYLEKNHFKNLNENLDVLLNYPEMLDVAKVILKGREKHGDSWLQEEGATMSLDENCTSIFRHLAKKQSKQVLDIDSNLDHDLHIACRALMSYVRKKRNLVHYKDKVKRSDADGSGCISLEENETRHKDGQYFKGNNNGEDTHQL